MLQVISRKNAGFKPQVRRFREQVIELVKRFQFRDRTAVCCFGVSVSQCYLLETLDRHQGLTMKQLAVELHLSLSTVTRVVGPLVEKGLVLRREDPRDRRRRLMALTSRGKRLCVRIWDHLARSEERILRQFPASRRDQLIQLLGELNQAFDSCREECCRPPNGVVIGTESA